MPAFRVLVAIVLGFSGLTGGLSLPAAAQTASAVTPDDFLPPLQRLNGTIVFTGEAGTQAPPGSETIGITLSGVTVVDGLPALAEEEQALRDRLTRGRIPVSELFEATAALEEAYAKAGFVLTRVVLPQQSLRDGGVLRVDVVNGFVETVDVAAVPQPVRGRLDALTVPLVDRAGITLRELERQLLLAGDASGVALTTALASGQRPGGTVLALDAQFRRITGFVGADNLSSETLGRPILNAGIEVNSALGYGETLYGRLSGSLDGVLTDAPRYRVAAIGALVPFGPGGATLNAEVTRSQSGPVGQIVATRSTFDRQSLRAIYPYIRSRDTNLTLQLGIDRQTDEQRITGGPTIYRDAATVLRGGVSGSRLGDDGALIEGSLTLSRGVDLFGAGRADGVPPSRQGSGPVFTKLNFAARYQRPIGETLSLSISGRAQTAFGDALMTAEQFGIAGAGELSAFDAGTLRGDSGYVIRAEIAHPFETRIAGRGAIVSPYAFAALGRVDVAQPTALERGSVGGVAWGAGVDLQLQGQTPFRADTLRMELGKGSRDDGDDETRFSISANIRF